MCPGATRSDSTAMVAAMTFAAPYLDRSSARWSIPLSRGTMAWTDLGLAIAANADSSSVAFTVIQSTSTGGASAATETSTSTLPNALSSRSFRGYCASDSRLTISVTGAPDRARQAPIRPPMPPAPRIACRNSLGIRSGFLCGRRIRAVQNFGFTQSVVALLGALVDAVDNVIGRSQAAPFQPKDHVRLAAHRPDVDSLLHPK